MLAGCHKHKWELPVCSMSMCNRTWGLWMFHLDNVLSFIIMYSIVISYSIVSIRSTENSKVVCIVLLGICYLCIDYRVMIRYLVYLKSTMPT